MKFAFYSAVLFLSLTAGLLVPNFTYANEPNQGAFCSWFSWLVQPIGFCQLNDSLVVVTHDDTVVNTIAETQRLAVASTETITKATSTPAEQAYGHTSDQYFNQEKNGVSEELLNQRIVEVLKYINSLPYATNPVADLSGSKGGGSLVTKDYVLKSLDKAYDQINKAQDNITLQTDFTNPTLSGAIMTGTTYLSGWLGIGTSSPSDVLSVNGPLYLASILPTNVLNRLYNVGGDLYWNGSILTSSTTGNWTGSAGNIFRLTGKVGIGTNSPTETLTVAGTLSAGTTTARIQDTGGQVCNVDAYGAVGDNSTDNYAAIMATIAACPAGGVVYFPMGQYRISQTIVLDEPVTLRGSYAPRWSYNDTPRSSIRAAFGTFVGSSIIHVRDQSISGAASGNNGGRIENLSIDGGSTGTDVHGLYFEGLVRDWKITDVDISQVTGDGFLAQVGAGSGNARGFTIRGLAIYSADGHGFRATALNDSYLEDVLTVGNALRGFYLSSMGETKINNSRAAFNALEGLYIDGSTNNGGLQFTDFSTDRNDRHGVRISATGTTTITFNGLLTRRDGANAGGGVETPYAGLAIIGSVTEKAAPVFVSNLAQITGVNDGGGGTVSPSVGVRVTNANYVKVDGQLWGVANAYVDGGGNGNFIIEKNSIIKTGIADASVDQLYDDLSNWTATTSGLFYGKSVSIGSTTGTRLLNITAPAQSGARFTDTTNNVIFDMRAEDFQAFFGTFSNHQLRFQTNNTSRLTIDTNGKIGIGTTAPDQALDVIGTIQSSTLLGGATSLSTDVNGNIIRTPSDIRLKTNIKDIDNSLAKVLALRGVYYDWADTERFGSEREVGFIAQEVDQVVPEVVRKGGEYWSLNTPNLLAVVVGAVQEMWKTITGNQERITILESRLDDLEAKVCAVPKVEQPVLEVSPEQPALDEIITESTFDVTPTDASTSSTTEQITETIVPTVPTETIIEPDVVVGTVLEPPAEPLPL